MRSGSVPDSLSPPDLWHYYVDTVLIETCGPQKRLTQLKRGQFALQEKSSSQAVQSLFSFSVPDDLVLQDPVIPSTPSLFP